jgi:hypothetical protein
MNEDLTILYITNSRMPAQWKQFFRENLLKAAEGAKIITISREELDWGDVNITQDQPPSKANIFWQILRGAKLATTPFVATADDDCAYPTGHFNCARPPMDTFLYNSNRWSLYTWSDPAVYSLKNYLRTNAAFIAPREQLITALEERFAKFPIDDPATLKNEWMGGEVGMKKAEQNMGVTVQKIMDFKSEFPLVQMDHDFFTVFREDKETVERRHRKKPGIIQAYDIPYWGRAEELTKYFKEQNET